MTYGSGAECEEAEMHDVREVLADFLLQGHLTYQAPGSDYNRADKMIRDLAAEGVAVVSTVHIAALETERANLLAALEKIHEAVEISECKIAEAYDCIIKARDLLQSSEALAPGAISRQAFVRTQDVFEQLEKAKRRFDDRTNVADVVATLRNKNK